MRGHLQIRCKCLAGQERWVIDVLPVRGEEGALHAARATAEILDKEGDVIGGGSGG